jgi:hypothetical protein
MIVWGNLKCSLSLLAHTLVELILPLRLLNPLHLHGIMANFESRYAELERWAEPRYVGWSVEGTVTVCAAVIQLEPCAGVSLCGGRSNTKVTGE